MLDTWNTEPEERPTFTELVSKLGDQLENSVKQVKDEDDGDGGIDEDSDSDDGGNCDDDSQ